MTDWVGSTQWGMTQDHSSAADEHVVVTRVAEGQWSDLRAVRLAALADSPMAFGSSLQRELIFDEDRWREWARSSALFIAFASGSPVGMVAGAPGKSMAERKVQAMWVAPDWRGRDVAAKLLDCVLEWARSESAQWVRLSVTHGNEPAHRLYQRYGFEETGVNTPLPSNPALDRAEMALNLRKEVRSPSGGDGSTA